MGGWGLGFGRRGGKKGEHTSNRQHSNQTTGISLSQQKRNRILRPRRRCPGNRKCRPGRQRRESSLIIEERVLSEREAD